MAPNIFMSGPCAVLDPTSRCSTGVGVAAVLHALSTLRYSVNILIIQHLYYLSSIMKWPRIKRFGALCAAMPDGTKLSFTTRYDASRN